MRYILETDNADSLFEKLKDGKMFSCEKSATGLRLRYNGVFTMIANPKILLVKKSEKQIEVNIISGIMLTVISLMYTAFFWALGAIAIIRDKLNAGLIIFTFLLPSLIWVLRLIFNRVISKQIIDEIKSV